MPEYDGVDVPSGFGVHQSSRKGILRRRRVRDMGFFGFLLSPDCVVGFLEGGEVDSGVGSAGDSGSHRRLRFRQRRMSVHTGWFLMGCGRIGAALG